MRRKSVLQFGAVLMSIGITIPGVNRSADKMVWAEGLSAFESDEGFTSTVPEEAVTQDSAEDSRSQETEEIVEDPGDNQTEEEISIALPQASISVPVSEFLPAKEEENAHLLNLYDGLYLLHIKSDSTIFYTFDFNQSLKENDVILYRFDSQNNTVDSEPVQDVMTLEEGASTLYLEMNSSSDYVLVINNGADYPGLAYTLKYTTDNPQKTEDESTLSGETEASTEVETSASVDGNTSEEVLEENAEENTDDSEQTVPSTEENHSPAEGGAAPDQEPVNGNETVSEEPTLTSVALNIDQDLETIPVEFLDYMNDVDVYSVTLIYSDGTEKVLDKPDNSYDLSVDFEDATDSEGIVHRTYHATVKDISTGMAYDANQSVEFGKKDPVEIKTEEMTSVILEKRKKWVMVQSIPNVTGRYAMNSDKAIDAIYYAADGGEVVCAENVFELQQGTTYRFLIKLS